MTWECHSCGEQHDSLPSQCRSCGTAPEIVENVWRCASCGHSDIGGTRVSCPGCGAEKGKEAQVAVDPSRRIEGERGRALLEDVWRYCAYCKTQVPPVSDRGVANERCPTCGGALSESKEQAARETLTAEQAASYRAPKIVGDRACQLAAAERCAVAAGPAEQAQLPHRARGVRLPGAVHRHVPRLHV